MKILTNHLFTIDALDSCCFLDIIYWRDPKKSGVALSLILLVVFILAKGVNEEPSQLILDGSHWSFHLCSTDKYILFQFALILWSLTYIAYWFSGFALVILGVLAVFSVPKVYEMYQEPIDANLAKVSEQLKKVSQMIEEKLPFLKKAQTEVEKKEQ
ncbi:Reticulon [Oesophagostomum dentatum]|uniref:Reticulon-like protein n=1 Tax=Oesophagostomum dentatum TaxID=61180 RepID=A0A0B1SVE2_OESDE|nr:Reticulon [Oesophagostomum dentatum]